jgi:hypothetical protein
VTNTQLQAANNALEFIGKLMTEDEGTHTLDTGGSSSMGFFVNSFTQFTAAGTSLSIGVADVDNATGPVCRAVRSSGVITMGVKGVFLGNGGGITSNAYNNKVPTTGSKTMTHGDLVAFCLQLTAVAGGDLINFDYGLSQFTTLLRPTVVGNLSARNATPNFIIRFNDGTYGWIDGSDIFATVQARGFNNTQTIKEYGQMFQFPFPMRIVGLYGMSQLAVDHDLVLYTDPLGSPVAQRTVSMDGNTLGDSGAYFFYEMFASHYDVAANQPIGAVYKPTSASNLNVFYKTLNNAAHRVTDPWGTNGSGISRNTGAFTSTNSNLDHYCMGLLVSGFDQGGAMQYRNSMGGNVL